MSAPSWPRDPTDPTIGIALATIDGKLDRIGDQLNRLVDMDEDHEARLRALEARPVVSPKALWLAVGVLSSVVAATAPFLAQLYGT